MAYPYRQINIMDQIGGGAYMGDEEAGYAPDYSGMYEFGQMPAPRQRPPVNYPPIRNPQVPTVNSGNVDEPVIDPQKQMADLMKQWYTPETQANDAYNSLLNNYPKREEPGFGRKLAASAAAWKGGPAAAEAFMYAPYLREKEDWMAQMTPRYNAANLERQNNINERTLSYNMATASINERKAAETERKNRETEKSREQLRAIQKYKAEHPNLIFKSDGPTIIIQDPADGSIRDTGIPTSNLSDFDRITLTGQWNERAAKARGETGGQIFQMEDADGNIKTYRIPPSGNPAEVKVPSGTLTRPGTDSSSATDDTKTRHNKIVDVLDANPQYSKFVKLNSKGFYEVQPRPEIGGSRFFGMDSPFTWDATEKKAQEEYDHFMSLWKPGYKPPPAPTPKPQTSAPAANVPYQPPGPVTGRGTAYGQPTKGVGPTTPPQAAAPQASRAQERRAEAWLKANNLRVTPANIDHAIKTGRVK